MIKNAKAGDIIFELDYDERYKTCKITEHTVNKDQDHWVYIFVDDNKGMLLPTTVFGSYEQAHRAYVSYLKSDLEYAKRDVDLITDILERIEKAKRKKV